MVEGTLEDLVRMETEFAQEFGGLDFELIVTEVPFGITLNEQYEKVWEGRQLQMRGKLTLPDGTKADGIATLPPKPTIQEERRAMSLITIAALRRVARFYMTKEPA